MHDNTQMTADEQLDIELTAYTLDELDADRRAAVEARLAEDPALRERLALVRDGAQSLSAALAAEPLPATAPQPTRRSPWVRRGLGMAACLGLAGGTAWVVERGLPPTEGHLSNTIAKNPDPTSVATGDANQADAKRLIAEARQFQLEMRYAEATEKLDEALTKNPNNYTALLMKEVIVDAKIATEYREATPSGRLTVDPGGDSPDQVGLAYKDVLTYPEDWPQLSSTQRSKETGEIQAGVSHRAPASSIGTDRDAVKEVRRILAKEPDARASQSLGDWGGGVVRHANATASTTEYDAADIQPRRHERFALAPTRPQATRGMEPAQQRTGLQEDGRLSERLVRLTQADDSLALDLKNHPQRTRALSLQRLSTGETYAPLVDNPFRSPAEAPLSTFSIDVDTASYANVRRMLEAGQLPPADAVRIEEFVNTFDYGYAPPAPDTEAPFATHVDVTAAPWAPGHRLVRIGLKGKEIATDDRPAANLVFLLDVSGSMKSPTKLPLVKDGLRKLVAALRMDDRIAIVVYAGASGLVLDSTTDHGAVLAAIDSLTPGGSTHGSAGIELAYDVATANFIGGGLDRVILCTDGDFNVGITDRSRLKTLIEEKAATGTYLSVLGFGSGNLKDATMEELSNAGDGNYGYIDSPQEAERLLAQQVNGTLLTIAKDVKIQVEFNPAHVASYRLIGYANRMLQKEDFNNDKVDAGDIGSGHTVTALYEVVPVGVAPPTPAVDPLKYAPPKRAAGPANDSDELLTVKLRYKAPDAPKERGTSKLLAVPVTDGGDGFDAADADARFAAAVAGFGMLLRQSEHAGDLDLPRVAEIARAANAACAGGPAERERRSAFVKLVERAQALPHAAD